MAENLDKCSIDTQIMITVLMTSIGESLKTNKLNDIRIFYPARSDQFLIKQFEQKLGHPIDELYSVCLEDCSNVKQANFDYLNHMVTEYAEFLQDNDKLHYDGYLLDTVGVLQIVVQGRTFYYIAFVLENDFPAAQA